MVGIAPIHSVVPAKQPIVWAGSRIQITRVSESEIALTRLRLLTPDVIWSVTLNVTDGIPDLKVGRCDAIVVADWYLLVRTNAEHWCEGTLHSHKLHHISSDGRVLWSLPWQVAGQVGLLGDRLIVLRFLSTLYDPISQPPLIAHLLDPRSGRSVLTHAVPIPIDLLSAYQREQGSALHVRLEHNGQGFGVRVSLFNAGQALRGERCDDGMFIHPLPFGHRLDDRPGFVCPECLTPGSLRIIHSIHLPPDSRSDEIALQIVACECCNFQSIAVYEELRRRVLEIGAWEHVGYRVPTALVDALRRTITQCPRPHDARCSCSAHVELARRDDRGRWQKPDGVEWNKSFPMKLIR